jgi:RNA polymerase sigma-70 factor, ECF subfamily
MFGLSRTTQQRTEFEAMLSPCLDGLYSSAVRLTRNDKDAEDLVQDAVMRAFRFFDKFERGTNFRAWLFKILTNTFINGYRRQAKAKTFSDESERQNVEAQLVSVDASDAAMDPESVFLERAQSAEVIKAIDSLPIDFRMVVIYSDLQELSYKEIADILDVPVGTVMSRLFRGRKQLQKVLMQREAQEASLIDLQAFRERKKLG